MSPFTEVAATFSSRTRQASARTTSTRRSAGGTSGVSRPTSNFQCVLSAFFDFPPPFCSKDCPSEFSVSLIAYILRPFPSNLLFPPPAFQQQHILSRRRRRISLDLRLHILPRPIAPRVPPRLFLHPASPSASLQAAPRSHQIRLPLPVRLDPFRIPESELTSQRQLAARHVLAPHALRRRAGVAVDAHVPAHAEREARVRFHWRRDGRRGPGEEGARSGGSDQRWG